MIVDTFTYNGEADILEIRLNILDSYVDQFVIVEAPTTFSGKPKPLYYEQQKERFKNWEHKIKYFVIDENYTDAEIRLAEKSPNTQGAAHWKHEFLQKESIKKALTHLKGDDVIFIGDVDEIWTPDALTLGFGRKIALKVYSYYLNNRSNENFWGGIFVSYDAIRGKDTCLNHLRTTNDRTSAYYGWHFTSMGGYEEVKRKLEDSYTEETYANNTVMNNLEENLGENRDFLGRNFIYTVDESELPKYIIDNKQKYKHLWK